MDVPAGSKRKLSLSSSNEDLHGRMPKTFKMEESSGAEVPIGLLKQVLELPVDIFTEIAKGITPVELLRLARSCKSFRNLLMSKQSVTAWRAAEMALGLPECPSDLSSPQYACLMFGADCMHCYDALGTNCLYALRLCLCDSCFSEQLSFGRNLPFLNNYQYLRPDEWQDMFYLVPALKCAAFSPKLTLASLHLDGVDFGEQGLDWVFYVPAVELAFERYSSLRARASKGKFISERQKMTLQIKSSAQELCDWINKLKEASPDTLAQIIEERRNEIYDSLKSLVYRREHFGSSNDYDEIRRQWEKATGISKDLKWEKVRGCLEEIRLKKHEKAQSVVIERRRTQLAGLLKQIMLSNDRCIISMEVAMEFPIVEQIVNDKNSNRSFSGTYSCDLKGQLIDRGKKWVDDLEEQCAKLLRDSRYDFGVISLRDDHRAAEVCQFVTSFFEVHSRPSHADSQLMTFDELVGKIREKYIEAISEEKEPIEFDVVSRIKPAPSYLIKTLYRAVRICAIHQDELVQKAYTFTCCRCARKDMTWADLVRHYYRKNVENATILQSWHAALDCITANDHAQVYHGRIATYRAKGFNDIGSFRFDFSSPLDICRCRGDGFQDPFCFCTQLNSDPPYDCDLFGFGTD